MKQVDLTREGVLETVGGIQRELGELTAQEALHFQMALKQFHAILDRFGTPGILALGIVAAKFSLLMLDTQEELGDD